MENIIKKKAEELVKLSLICMVRSAGWTESNKHVAARPSPPAVPPPRAVVTSLTSRHTPASARPAVLPARLNASVMPVTEPKSGNPAFKDYYRVL
ncbi:hypothetical protein ABEB36_011229 [Hypothenemus hampei]|uniref:Uncharacterized protein n=1 Tax=Hypothenemus hampei TaxID=57062 RepID=A0ABD1EEM6_HYPHA